ncbi:palmitoyltransferase ZDHHC21 isoform X3 [Phyllopteryx taeniolatus]|uniref:palmitoyltransferase ZDHHC21 isoform X3 n=1 Tax=Phyllopteryx taeniolatus TaxID=161469 RepID=UPI002AD22691|nr:palmitoyltransferase ZDHHC21 isoform X3 [Phyllopteryx taeniolatus]
MKPRLHLVVDPAGWLCVSVVFGIWLYNSVFVPKLVLLPHYREGHVPWAIVIWHPRRIPATFRRTRIYLIPSESTGNCATSATSCDPKGPITAVVVVTVYAGWTTTVPGNWINNCVGEDNHWLFLQLCFYTQVLSGFTVALDFCQYYYFQPLAHLDQEKFTTRHELALLRASAITGVVMFGGISALFYSQLVGVLSDTTTIEKMTQFSSEIHGLKQSWQRALAEVCGTHRKALWFVPLRSRRALQAGSRFGAHV